MANITIQTPEPPVELLPSHIAAVKNDIEKLSTLLQEKAPLIDPSTKETPLHAAAKTGSVEALRWLVKNKAVELDSKSVTGYTPAHLAAVYGHLDCLKLLLTYDFSRGKELAAMVEDGGLTVLSLATLQGDKEMVAWLLDKFPETAHISNSNGDQVVHFAAAEGLLDILKMLVEKFGKEIVSIKDSRSTNPVFFAAQQGKENVLDYLINELDQDPVAKDKDGLTTVHAATQNERASTVKWLINKLGPQYILEKTIDGATPLHMAAASGNTDILKFLLDNLEDKKDVNVTDNINATPAHDAAEYGKIKTMLLLLKNGADISITDTENKTPYQLALEQSHNDVADMLADYRDNGPSALQAYEKRRGRQNRDDKIKPRTSRQEAEELSNVIVQTNEALDTYKQKQLKRQESLKRIHEAGVDDKQSTRSQPQSPQKTDDDDDDEIEHALGPRGDPYALPGKRPFGKSRVKGGRPQQGSDIDDFISETMSQREYNRGHHFRGGSYDEDPPYAAVNHDTGSNYSRPSRVKRYQDSDSEISGLTGRSDFLYDAHSHGFFPPGYTPMYPPSLPPPRGKKVKRPGSASSKGSHQSGSQYRGPHPMGMSPAQFGYNHPMYFGYPQMYPGFAQGGGLIAMPPHQQHQAAMQGRPMFMPQMHPMQLQRLRQQQQQQQSRRKSLTDKKKMKKLSTETQPSTRKLHTDQDIGYGPGLESTDSGKLLESKYEDAFHPPAPPITSAGGGRMEANKEVLKFDSNFLMAKPGESNEIRHHAGTALNPAKAKHRPYDGRYDEYIMTDSEEEYEVDEYHKVGFAAEVACILAIGCVAGLKGLSKMRRGKPALPVPKSPDLAVDKPSLNSAWDQSYHGVEETPKKKKGKRSRRNSISDIDASLVKDDISPEVFAGKEEVGRTTWDKSNQKKQKKVEEEQKKRPADPEEPQSELLTAELQKQSYQSVSKALGEKLLYDTIGARHSSMLNIASSTTGSRMSLNASSADEENDDDFDDAISIVHGVAGPRKRKRSKPDPVTIDIEGDVENLIPESKEKHKKKKGKNKEKKDKEKKHKKTKKGSKEGSEDDAEVIENTQAVEDGITFSASGEENGEVKVDVEGKQKEEEVEKVEVEKEKEENEQEKEEKVREKQEKEKEQREKKEQEKREKEQKEREKKEQEKREKEQRERQKKEAAREEKERKDRERKEKEALEKERKEVEKREREQKDKEKKEKGAIEKEKRDKERKEKEAKDKERKEREKREKEARIKEKKEREAREKNEREERRENERKEKEAKLMERREREREEKEERERELREKREEEMSKRSVPTPVRPAPPPPENADSSDDANANQKKSTDRGKDSQAPAQQLVDTLLAKPASKATPPMRGLERMKAAQPVKAPMEYSRAPAGAQFEYDSDEPREVENKVYMFDTESDESELEEVADVKITRQSKAPAVQDPDVSKIEQTMMNLSTDLNDFLESTTPSKSSSSVPRKNQSAPDNVGIKADQTKMTPEVQTVGGGSREGERSRNMLEDSQINDDMQLGFGTDISAMADEMHDFYETEDFTHMYEEGSTPSMDADSYTGIPGDGDLVLVTKHDLERRLEEAAHTNQAYVSTQEQSVSAGGRAGGRGTSDSAAQYDEMANMSEMGTQSSGVGGAKGMASHSIGVGGGVDMSEAGVQSSLQTFMHSIGTQGSAGYSQSFEHDVLVMLQKMNDRMADMRSNPTVTQKEINQQEQMQQQLIQSTIGMSLKDPEVMKNLLAMLKEQLPKPSIRRRNSTAFADLQAKLLQAQEEQRQETMKHYETQTEFQEYMRRQLEEQSKQQMMGLQTNFEMYSKKMQEQLAEQQRRWDEELKKRRDEEPKSDKKRKRSRDKRSKKPRKPKAVNRGSSDSSQSDTDEGVMLQAPKQNKPKVVSFPAIKTMQAKILTQNLLEDDEMRTDSQVSIEKIKKKQEARGKLTRMDTVMKFDHASEAMRRYESTGVVTHISEKDEGTTDNDPDDEEMIQVQAVRPVTLKRAEIKTQSGSGFTPARPAPAPPDGKGKVGRIQRIESGSDADQVLDQHSTEGAGSELSQKLKKRWQRN